jgi:tetratricopeptide (TPR) repeat protein
MGEERLILPPPPNRRCEGEILRELPDDLGMVLWQDLRHLCAWAEVAERTDGGAATGGEQPRARDFRRRTSLAGLFNASPPEWVLAKRRAAAAACGELAEALARFGSVTSAPLLVDRQSLAAACARVVEWALERELPQTAIEFAEAAALVDHRSPAMANLAGRVTRNAGETARAEIWFNRGITFSREQQDAIELTRGHLGYGILCQDQGRVRCAMRHFNVGARRARKAGLEWLAAEVQHDIMLLLTVRGRFADAEKHARLALRWYGKRHARLPLFAADVALLMVLERNYSLAARLARASLRHVSAPAARSVILALHARALAGAGSVNELDWLRRRVVRITTQSGEREAVALWHLGHAERLAGEWDASERSAARALEIAESRRDAETAALARHLLAAARERRPAPPPSGRRGGEFLEFIDTLSHRLATWSPDQRQPSALRARWAA